MRRTVFYLSDRTGITAEALGHTLLTQFDQVVFHQVSLPFVDTPEKAKHAVERINQAALVDRARPVVFSTLIRTDLREIIARSDGLLFDLFDTFVSPLEGELGVKSSRAMGRSHGMGAYAEYKARIDAVNFALSNDDGVTTRNYPDADVVLVGVSRSGKTPTCLYLALQYGILAANYPFTEEDLGTRQLPRILRPFRRKLFGLTIDAHRLAQIRHERRPDSRYASLPQCTSELRAAESVFRQERIAYVDTTSVSIEEIAATILHRRGMKRRIFA